MFFTLAGKSGKNGLFLVHWDRFHVLGGPGGVGGLGHEGDGGHWDAGLGINVFLSVFIHIISVFCKTMALLGKIYTGDRTTL